jgi:hypothetical protein
MPPPRGEYIFAGRVPAQGSGVHLVAAGTGCECGSLFLFYPCPHGQVSRPLASGWQAGAGIPRPCLAGHPDQRRLVRRAFVRAWTMEAGIRQGRRVIHSCIADTATREAAIPKGQQKHQCDNYTICAAGGFHDMETSVFTARLSRPGSVCHPVRRTGPH